MGSLTFGVIRTTPAASRSKTINLSDAQVGRIITYAQAKYPTMANGLNASGQPQVRAATLAESVDLLIDAVLARLIAEVKAHEQSEASRTAAAAVADIA